MTSRISSFKFCLRSPQLGGVVRTVMVAAISFSGLWPASSIAQPAPVKETSAGDKERFALLVGVDHYSIAKFDTLTAPGNDARSIRSLLIDKYSFLADDSLPDSQKHIKLLVGAQATHAAIRDSFRSQLIDNAKRYSELTGKDASVVFYFSGHGSTTANQQHRTLAPSDRGVNGVPDILDTELAAWLRDLSQYTQDITVILDSCSSGARTKALQERLAIKELPPIPASGKAVPSEDLSIIAKDLGNSFISPNHAYSSIYGCLRSEYCYEIDAPDGSYSVLTYFLVKTLTVNSHVSYQTLASAVSRAIPPSIAQHPQAEGNIARPVFGIEGEEEDPFVAIKDGPVTGRTLTIAAGKSLGVQAGTFIAVYSPDARHLKGDQDKLAVGRVTASSDFAATVELSEQPAAAIPATAKVVIVTPYFGEQRLRVNLEANPSGTTLSPIDRKLIEGVRTGLSSSALISLVSSLNTKRAAIDAGWDVGLQKGCFDLTKHPAPIPKSASTTPCAEPLISVFYLVTPSSNSALYDFSVRSTSPDAVDQIVDLLQQRVKQENLRSLNNMASPYNDQVQVTIFKVHEEKTATGEKKGVQEPTELGKDGGPRLAVDQNFVVKIHNGSTKPLDAALLVLGTSGKVMLLTPRGTGQLIDPRGDLISDVYTVGLPRGRETYLAIAYTPPKEDEASPNFSLLEQPGAPIGKLKDISDPLSWLVNQAGVGRSKDPAPSTLNVSSWTVARVDIVVE